jgi:hypothetical protein
MRLLLDAFALALAVVAALGIMFFVVVVLP